jgi:hypothetical protein
MRGKLPSVPVQISLTEILIITSEHAGVPPDPVTDAPRLTLGALDAIREESSQLNSPLPPSYDEIPVIVFEFA